MSYFTESSGIFFRLCLLFWQITSDALDRVGFNQRFGFCCDFGVRLRLLFLRWLLIWLISCSELFVGDSKCFLELVHCFIHSHVLLIGRLIIRWYGVKNVLNAFIHQRT